MYAQLCLRLSKEAPNFEPPEKKTCTFSKLLINTCRDRFLNRSTLTKPHLDNISSSGNYYNTDCGNGFGERSGTSNGSIGSDYAAESNGLDEQDEEERKHIAKQRMLGNIKFIGELHKLGLCTPNTLHSCILQLLEKTSKKTESGRTATLDDRCEDLECLCELIRTCGKNLDSEQGKGLMDQYFRQMEKRSQSNEYPNRIRFMLRDVIELRRSDWVPRKVATTEGPVPIQQLRNEEEIMIRPSFPYRNHRNDGRNSDPDHWMSKSPLNLQSSGFNDMFGGLGVSSSSHIIPPYGQNTNSYLNRNDNRGDDGGNSGRIGSKTMINSRDRDNNSRDGGNNYRHNNHRNNQNYNHNNYNNRYSKHNNHQHGGGGGNNSYGNNNYGNNNSSTSMGGNKELAPRFKRTMMTPQQNNQQQDPVENLLFRPPAGSLLFTANTANLNVNNLPISQQQRPHSASAAENGYHNNQHSSHSYQNNGRLNAVQSTPATNGNGPAPNQNHIQGSKDWPTPNGTVNNNANNQQAGNLKDSQTISASSKQNVAQPVEKPVKAKKDKGPGKEEILKKITTFLNERLIQNAATIVDSNINDDETVQIDGEKRDTIESIVQGFVELKVPEKYMRDAITALLNEMLERHDAVLEKRTIEFLCCLKRENKLNANATLDGAFKVVINGMGESNVPRITTLVAQLLAQAVTVKLCKLSDIAGYTDNGQHYPLLLLVLQQMHKIHGKPALVELFNASKVNLMNSLPEADRNKERMAVILEDRNLSFLYPLLRVQSELQKQLLAGPNPQQFYKWIKDNVEPDCLTEPGFITALVTVLIKYITQETTLTEGIDTTKIVEKPIIEKEKALLEKYCPVLIAFLTGKHDLQLIAVYALQVFCHSVGFPKGMLLRWFTALYDLNVIEEDPFLQWKEDISDAYPGKGQALFQVNTWLTWLEQAESEEDDDED